MAVAEVAAVDDMMIIATCSLTETISVRDICGQADHVVHTVERAWVDPFPETVGRE